MKILITGSDGFIGKHLIKQLEELKHVVYGFDLKKSRAENINYLPSIRSVINKVKPDIVIHLAALAGVRESLEIPEQYFETNITGTYNVLSACVEFGVKKVLVTSSSSVYGNMEKTNETVVCDNQLSPYAISKKTTELVAKYFSDKIPTIVFRPFTVYGENGRPDMVIGKLLEAAKNNIDFEQYGNTKRTYTNVHDLCDCIIKLIDYTPKNNFEIFNIGGDEIISLDELVDIIKLQYPQLKVKKLPMKKCDMPVSIADISKAEELLGWSPKRKLKEELIKLCQKLS